MRLVLSPRSYHRQEPTCRLTRRARCAPAGHNGRVRVPALHGWPTTARAAIALQTLLAARVRLAPLAHEPALVAGADVAFSPDGRRAIAGVVLWRAATGEVVEARVAKARCRFPYVPGLLSFRELPALLAAFRRLQQKPDVILCDAQGLAHPRRCGLACHLGLWLDVPTIGCAKSRLCGDHGVPPPERGSHVPLRLDGVQVGVVLRTRSGVAPLYVSPGHRCDVESAWRIALACATRYRLPEPTRLAHSLVTRARLAKAGK